MFERRRNPGPLRREQPVLEEVRRLQALTTLGRRTAVALLGPDARRLNGPRDLGRLLQRAADTSDQHHEILRIADEVHAVADDVRSSAGMRTYVLSALRFVEGDDATSFLVGMFEVAERLDLS